MLPPELAIRVTGLSKKYRLFDSPRQRLKEALDPRGRTYHKEFWALQDVAFEVPKGQTVGIIGRNGSGKSTLLQILTGVMQPTSGTVEVAGRVVALLELGAGFDPDFTGRENARQYGRMQGLTAAEAEARLGEIEAFANIGEFFDREVRRYSSGMFARLAFAAAISVEPDVLILDEILAVGDARFQQRCVRRIQEMQESGCTVLFVSHSTEQVLRLCNQALLLDTGRMLDFGPTPNVVDAYHQVLYGSQPIAEEAVEPLGNRVGEEPRMEQLPAAARDFIVAPYFALTTRPYYNAGERRLGNREAEIVDVLALVNGKPLEMVIEGNETLTLLVKIRYSQCIAAPRIGWAVVSPEGILILGSNSQSRNIRLPDAAQGELAIYRVDLDLRMCTGDYFLNLGVALYEPPEWRFIDNRRAVLHFRVADSQKASGFVDLPSTCSYIGSIQQVSV